MHRAALVAASATLTLAILVPVASAEVTTMRIEGKTQTLFEGPIDSTGHGVQAVSDRRGRRCDATNNGANPAPGPTPTATAADAMAIAGWGFDAQWYPGFDDYFIERFGPTNQGEGDYEYWGILVDRALTPVGGCQFLLEEGQSSLWAYDAFNGRPYLEIDAAGSQGTVVKTAVGDELTVEVSSYDGGSEAGGPAGTPEPIAGVPVAPVRTAPNGFQTVLDGRSLGDSNAQGELEVSWDSPGWKRIKAAEPDESAVRSNRLDVCVVAQIADPCPPEPDDVAARAYEPDSAFSLGRAKVNARKGSAILTTKVPGPGRLALAGRGVKSAESGVLKAGANRLALTPTSKVRKQLRKRGRATVRAAVTYTPSNGDPASRGKPVKLRLKRGR